jgi:hypothetical protein
MKALLFFILPSNCATAQDLGLYEKILDVQQKGKVMIDTLFFDGIWRSVDSSTCGLHFKYHNNELKLMYDDITTFSFTKFTYLKEATIFGTYINWPPQYCFISVINKNTIEVQFYNASSHFSTKKLYRR